MFNAEGRTFKSHVEDALREVKGGQHLRFINRQYRTKEVCRIAVLYDSRTFGIRDLGSVPAGNLDYIYEELKKGGHDYDNETIEKEFRERKEDIAKPGYFDEGITCWQDLLKEYNATDYDDYLEKKFNSDTEKAKKIRETAEWRESEFGKKWLAEQPKIELVEGIEVEMSARFQRMYQNDDRLRSLIQQYMKDTKTIADNF